MRPKNCEILLKSVAFHSVSGYNRPDEFDSGALSMSDIGKQKQRSRAIEIMDAAVGFAPFLASM